MSRHQSFVVTNQWNGQPSLLSSPYNFSLTINPKSGDLVISIDAPFHNDPPPPTPAGRLDRLWEFEVVEIFIGSGCTVDGVKDSPYLEIEIGPHGHWLMIAYSGEASWEDKNDEVEFEKKPITQIDLTAKRFTAEIAVPTFLLPEPECGDDFSVTWTMNFFGMHGLRETREYLSLVQLPGSVPNFHQLNYFVPVSLREDVSTGSSPVVSKPKKISFSPSTVATDNSRRLIEDVTSAVQEDAVTRPRTFVETARMIKESFNQPDMDERYLKQVQSDEFVVLYAIVWKRKSWSHKKRMLILTSKPRLFYLNTSQKLNYKGSIPWTIKTPLTIQRLDDTRFDIVLFDNSRTYHINDKHNGSDQWVSAVNQINEAWGDYLKTAANS